MRPSLSVRPFHIIVNSPFKIFEKVGDVMADLGMKLETKAKNPQRPTGAFAGRRIGQTLSHTKRSKTKSPINRGSVFGQHKRQQVTKAVDSGRRKGPVCSGLYCCCRYACGGRLPGFRRFLFWHIRVLSLEDLHQRIKKRDEGHF